MWHDLTGKLMFKIKHKILLKAHFEMESIFKFTQTKTIQLKSYHQTIKDKS